MLAQIAIERSEFCRRQLQAAARATHDLHKKLPIAKWLAHHFGITESYVRNHRRTLQQAGVLRVHNGWVEQVP